MLSISYFLALFIYYNLFHLLPRFYILQFLSLYRLTAISIFHPIHYQLTNQQQNIQSQLVIIDSLKLYKRYKQMVKIMHTNVIVDEFSTARNNPFSKYIHFLTHIHADHVKGLSNSWDYGPIYCSSITKKLIMLKYPRLKCLKQLQLEKQYTIPLSSELQITVTLFDANHCAGGVMLLFEGYMGTVLYTGDMRFDREIFSQYSYLYPHVKRNKQFKHCSLNIDFLYLDTTFLHPKFNFPPKSQALQQLDHFIQTTINKAKQEKKFIQFYIGIDSFGKEEVLVHLAEKFQTLVTVTEERYKNIELIGLDTELFTTDPQAGFIHIVLKRQLYQHVSAKQNSMGIILTGWANYPHSRNSRIYAIPYSLHSSYPELVHFVDSIRPCYIDSILEVALNGGLKGWDNEQKSWSDKTRDKVGGRDRDGEKNEDQTYSEGRLKLIAQCKSPITINSIGNEFQLFQQVNTTQYLNTLRKQFTTKPSQQLTFLMTNTDFQTTIRKKLKLDRNTIQTNKEEITINAVNNIARVENINRAGAKLNNQRNQEEIQRIKMKLKNKKESTIKYSLNQYNSKVINRNISKMMPESMLNDDKSQNNLEKDDEKQNSKMVQNKKQKTYSNDQDKSNLNIYNLGNLPLELQDYVQEWIQQQISKNRELNNSVEPLSSQGNDNNHVSEGNGKEGDSNRPSQVRRRNKWRQKVQEGEIDLFGKINMKKRPLPIPIPSDSYNNNNCSNNSSNKKTTTNDNNSNSSSLRLKKPSHIQKDEFQSKSKLSKYIQHQNVIQLISSEDSDNDNTANKRTIQIQSNNSSSLSSIRKKYNNENNNSSNGSLRSGTNKEDHIMLPIQRQPNQRSIVEFFSKRQQHNDKVINQRIQNHQSNSSQISQLIQNSRSNKSSQQQQQQQQQQEEQEQEPHQQQSQLQLQQRTQTIRYPKSIQTINDQNESNQSQQSSKQQMQEQQIGVDDFDQEKQQLKRGIHSLKHCSQISILAINIHQLEQIEQSSNYNNFFITKNTY